MKRLTDKRLATPPGQWREVTREEARELKEIPVPPMRDLYYRLSQIEDILGDDYDLDRLRELWKAGQEGKAHIGRCLDCKHYEGLAVCEYLGDCGGTNWICGWFEPKEEKQYG